MKSVRSNEQGFGHLLVVLIVVVVLAVIGFTGYEVMSKNKSSTSSSNTAASAAKNSSSAASTAGVAATCLATYHDVNLCHFAAYSNIDKIAYEANLKTTDPQGAVSSLTLDSDGKGNTKLSGTGNGASLNSITLNGNLYTQDPGTGVWLEYTGASVPDTSDSNPASNMDVAVGSAGITYKSEGKVSCGDLTCYKYAVNVTATPEVKQTVEFDTSSYKLREWDYSSSSQGSTVMTLSYPKVNITTPSPVKQFSVNG